MKLIIPPGATPIDDLSGLKVPITTQSQLDALEFDNIHKAEQKYFRPRKFKDISWFKESFFKELHKAMFGEVWEWAGKYRTKDVLPVGVDPYKIPMLIYELIQDVEYWTFHSKDMTLLERAARIHHRLAFIHPFPNGNGRFSRFVSNLFLMSHRCTLSSWPQEMHKNGCLHRTMYLGVLREADQGNFQPLIDYIRFLGAKEKMMSL